MGKKHYTSHNSEFIEANQGHRLLSVSSSKEEGGVDFRRGSAEEGNAAS